jgi:ribosomal protein S18 acetylase RimI-like enzyme
MIVRRLQAGDEQVAAAILKSINDQLLVGMPSPSHFETFLGNDTCYVIAAIGESGVLGFALAYRFPSFYAAEQTAYLYDIEVLPEQRNRGIGKQLIAELLTHLKSDGVNEMWLGTAIDNFPAQRLFSITGAEKEEEQFYEYIYYLDGIQ